MRLRHFLGQIGKKGRKVGANAESYYKFMKIAREQVISIGGDKSIGRNALKAIDEYNYCIHVLGLSTNG